MRVGHQDGVSIFCGIGERCREGEELYRDMKEAGVLPKMVMLFGQMNEPPGARFRVGHAALTMAEYFRDDEQRDVLLLIDNIFRFIQAGMEVSGLMGQMPSRIGYQPTMGTELSRLEERIANTDTGAIILVRVQDETKHPRPGTDARHALVIRSEPWQARFQGLHHPGHVAKHPVGKFLFPNLIPEMFLRIEFGRIGRQPVQAEILGHRPLRGVFFHASCTSGLLLGWRVSGATLRQPCRASSR